MLRDIALYRVLSHFMNDGMHYKYQSIDREDRIVYINGANVSMLPYKKRMIKNITLEKNIRGWGDYIRKQIWNLFKYLRDFGYLKYAKRCFFCVK